MGVLTASTDLRGRRGYTRQSATRVSTTSQTPPLPQGDSPGTLQELIPNSVARYKRTRLPEPSSRRVNDRGQWTPSPKRKNSHLRERVEQFHDQPKWQDSESVQKGELGRGQESPRSPSVKAWAPAPQKKNTERCSDLVPVRSQRTTRTRREGPRGTDPREAYTTAGVRTPAGTPHLVLQDTLPERRGPPQNIFRMRLRQLSERIHKARSSPS